MLWFSPDDPNACENAARALSSLEGVEEIGKCVVDLTSEEGLTIMVKNGSAVIVRVVRSLDGAGVSVEQLRLSAPTLDEVFLKLTGKTLTVLEPKEAAPRRRRGF
jgi:hypothetical protein